MLKIDIPKFEDQDLIKCVFLLLKFIKRTFSVEIIKNYNIKYIPKQNLV